LLLAPPQLFERYDLNSHVRDLQKSLQQTRELSFTLPYDSQLAGFVIFMRSVLVEPAQASPDNVAEQASRGEDSSEEKQQPKTGLEGALRSKIAELETQLEKGKGKKRKVALMGLSRGEQWARSVTTDNEANKGMVAYDTLNDTTSFNPYYLHLWNPPLEPPELELDDSDKENVVESLWQDAPCDVPLKVRCSVDARYPAAMYSITAQWMNERKSYWWGGREVLAKANPHTLPD